MRIKEILTLSPVIPVVAIKSVEQAVPLANALLAGGIPVIEVTLRTAAAVASIEAIATQCPTMCVGAGTVWSKKDAKRVRKAGAQFVVTPGRTDRVYNYCKKHALPLLPGAQTVSEIAKWHSRGLGAVKFFPAEVAGGISALKAFGAVFPAMQFCPTGGIQSTALDRYLALPQVPCVGGSWIVDADAVETGRWGVITEAAAAVTRVSASAPTPADAPPWD